MALARSLLVDHLACSVYHCVSRCVRRQFLLSDAVRTAWLVQRLELLASLFAIDILEFAILANHIHLLLRIRPEVAWCWTAEEVAERWLALRAADPFVRVGDASLKPSKEDIERAAADEPRIDEWRRRLADLGWFHKELKEPCARMWNEEDDVTGHFWEGRYSSKVTLTDVALTAQAFYVMLNAVRAGVESGVGRSETTSIGLRMKRIVREIRAGLHGDAVEAYERRVVNGSWQPALPCRPGSVADLSDEEYSTRVARGRRNAEVRNAALKEAETIGRLAMDANVEDLVSMMTGGSGAGVNAQAGEVTCGGEGEVGAGARVARTIRPPESLVRIPRHRLRRRSSSRIPADATASERSLLRSLENPFRAELVERGSTAVLAGMTLGALVQLLDAEGREVYPGKTGRILPGEPAALERLRGIALGGETNEPGGAATSTGSAIGATPWPVTVAATARETLAAALAALARHRQTVDELLKARGGSPGKPSEAPDGTLAVDREPGALAQPAPKRRLVRWFGSANGGERQADAEAARRGSARVVTERPVFAV